MSEVSEKSSDFVRDLRDAARKNPISAALIGMGVLWLFTGGRTVERAANFVGDTGFDRIPDATGNAFDAARSSLRSGANTIGEGVISATGALRDGGAAGLDRVARVGSEYADAAYDYAQTIPETGAAVIDRARQNLSELFRAQPLALGAIGLAIGAGIAAALPSTEVEAAYFGEASDAVKEQATEFASEQAARAATVAEDVVSAASEEAQRQGLTVESAKSAIADIPGKVGRVVNAAGKGISDKLNPTAS